jgi:hypothetical protein
VNYQSKTPDRHGLFGKPLVAFCFTARRSHTAYYTVGAVKLKPKPSTIFGFFVMIILVTEHPQNPEAAWKIQCGLR